MKSRSILQRILVIVLVFAAQSSSAAEPAQPEPYPSIPAEQLDQWTRLLVVAELEPGQYYAARPCPQSDTEVRICLDGPPFWYRAKVSETLYGSGLPSELRISTTSHYGMEEADSLKGPSLVSLRSDGDRFLMPRYAKRPLIRDKQGALYLPIFDQHPFGWLPCEVATLREEVFQDNFEDGAALARTALKRYGVKNSPDLYRMSGAGAWPRYAIAVERLRDWLQKAGPGVRMSCDEKTVASAGAK